MAAQGSLKRSSVTGATTRNPSERLTSAAESGTDSYAPGWVLLCELRGTYLEMRCSDIVQYLLANTARRKSAIPSVLVRASSSVWQASGRWGGRSSDRDSPQTPERKRTITPHRLSLPQVSPRRKLIIMFTLAECLVLAGLLLQIWTLRQSIKSLLMQTTERQVRAAFVCRKSHGGCVGFLVGDCCFMYYVY